MEIRPVAGRAFLIGPTHSLLFLPLTLPPDLAHSQVATQFGEAAAVHRVLARGGIFLRRDGFAFVSGALAALAQVSFNINTMNTSITMEA